MRFIEKVEASNTLQNFQDSEENLIRSSNYKKCLSSNYKKCFSTNYKKCLSTSHIRSGRCIALYDIAEFPSELYIY